MTTELQAWRMTRPPLARAAPAPPGHGSHCVLHSRDPESRIIWLDRPAERFTEAAPLGNGRLGATLFGRVASTSAIVLNETGVWSGSPQERRPAGCRPGAAGDPPAAPRRDAPPRRRPWSTPISPAPAPDPDAAWGPTFPSACYQTLGELQLTFRHAGVGEAVSKSTDVNSTWVTPPPASATSRSGVRFQREAWVSAPDQATVLRLTADRPGSISLDATLARAERATVESRGSDRLLLSGQLNDGREGGTGVRFAAMLRVRVPRRIPARRG
jgi:alpha-L-fucosidase 2